MRHDRRHMNVPLWRRDTVRLVVSGVLCLGATKTPLEGSFYFTVLRSRLASTLEIFPQVRLGFAVDS